MKRKVNTNKIYELIGRAVVYSACYVGSIAFFYWGFLQRINILGGKKK